MKRGLIFIVIFVPTALPVAADEKSDKALKAIQGEWKIEKMVAAGEAAPAEIASKLTFTIKDDQMIPSDNPKDVATIKLDLEKKPASFDVTDRSKKTMLGIYELSGDTLKICLVDPGAERPKEFTSTKGNKAMLMVLKRAGK